MRNPAVHSGPAPAWAPGGLAIGPDGRLYAPLLAGQRLTHFALAGEGLADQRNQFSELGRQRAATAANGFLYFTTDGADAELLRVPFDGAQAPACPAGSAVATPAPTAATPRTGLGRLKRLLVAWSRRLRSVGLRTLRRRGAVRLRASGLPRGTLGVRLVRRGRVLALGRRGVSPARATTLRLKLTRRGRVALRVHPRSMRLTLRATVRRSAGGRTTAARRLLLRR